MTDYRRFQALVIAASVVLAPVIRAQQNAAAADANRKPLEPLYANQEACQRCHFVDQPNTGVPSSSRDFVETTQAAVWEKQDKHRQAFRLLVVDGNRELVLRLLGFDLREYVENGSLLLDKLQDKQRDRLRQCLRCHAAWPQNADVPPIDVQFGVSCQGCHGPGRHWFQPHQEPQWRVVSAAEKARLHMADLRNPIERARLCTSCHVGDVQQDRLVTHEMYVLGHPPLPSIEPESYASQMPPHWRTLSEKLAPGKKPFAYWESQPTDALKWVKGYTYISSSEIKAGYRQANYEGEHDPSSDLSHTRNVIVGGMVLLQSSATLLANLAQQHQASDRVWPEFAMYDCSACHHDLRGGPWVTGRPFRPIQPPGRPPMPLWPMALTNVGVNRLVEAGQATASDMQELERLLRTVEIAVTRQPFGRPMNIQSSARELAQWLDAKTRQVARAPFGAPAAQQALIELSDPKYQPIGDYHSARQIAWAIREIAKELGTRRVNLEADKLFRGERGEDVLMLDLPAGQSGSVIRNQPLSLDAITNYRPDWFAAEVARLRAALAKQ